MQQMAGNMSLLNPFVFNQFGAYGAYAQVSLAKDSIGQPPGKKSALSAFFLFWAFFFILSAFFDFERFFLILRE